MIQIGQLNRNHINTNNYKVINQNNNKFINSDDARDEEADEIIEVRNKRSQSLISEEYFSTDGLEDEQIVNYQYISCTVAQNISNKE